MKSINEKAHEIAWQYTKYCDPIVCKQAPIAPKQEWLEMAAIEGANYVLEKFVDIVNKNTKPNGMEDRAQMASDMLILIAQLKK